MTCYPKMASLHNLAQNAVMVSDETDSQTAQSQVDANFDNTFVPAIFHADTTNSLHHAILTNPMSNFLDIHC